MSIDGRWSMVEKKALESSGVIVIVITTVINIDFSVVSMPTTTMRQLSRRQSIFAPCSQYALVVSARSVHYTMRDAAWISDPGG